MKSNAGASQLTETVQTEFADAGKNNASEWREYGLFLLKLAAIVLIFRSLIFAPFNIPSESMHPRLLIGDYLLVSKWPYGISRYSLPFSPPLFEGRLFGSLPDRGDVVVVRAPGDANVDYIKRVIGLPGDVIQMRAGTLEINGELVKKLRVDDFVTPVTQGMRDAAALERTEYACWKPQYEEPAKAGGTQCRYPQYRETLPEGKSYLSLDIEPYQKGDDTDAIVVPEGQLLLMGDNRDRSADSRYPADGVWIGLVPTENLIGRAQFVVFSTDGSARWLLPWTWFSAARWDRIGEGF
ncbi:MAG: signal peptidase I [Sphingomonadales bacterium]|jgi:signal peptidase I|nr:signal peptidase I [Sphingomonadales bacterium]MBK9003609.1 signal peptidase I [Sphingomonadales bacterium]MBK9268782.1 signal peptidase I [Sphingomonadales bacterium]MBP6433604.1 signal peptidase I [Sphingorhabdus sp.]